MADRDGDGGRQEGWGKDGGRQTGGEKETVEEMWIDRGGGEVRN